MNEIEIDDIKHLLTHFLSR